MTVAFLFTQSSKFTTCLWDSGKCKKPPSEVDVVTVSYKLIEQNFVEQFSLTAPPIRKLKGRVFLKFIRGVLPLKSYSILGLFDSTPWL